MKTIYITIQALIFTTASIASEVIKPTQLMQDMKQRMERTIIVVKKPKPVMSVQAIKEPTEYFDWLWKFMPELSVEEMIYAYECMEKLGLSRIMTQAESLEFLDKPDLDVGLTASLRNDGNALEICLSVFNVRYSKDPIKQKAEQIAVTNAAMSAVIKVHRKKMDNREPDFAKRYPLPDFDKIISQAKTIREGQYTYYLLRKRAYDLQERPRLVEHFLFREEVYLARCFLRFRSGDIDRIRQELTEAGYPSAEARKAFWERVGKYNEYFFNASHLPLLYDPAKP